MILHGLMDNSIDLKKDLLNHLLLFQLIKII